MNILFKITLIIFFTTSLAYADHGGTLSFIYKNESMHFDNIPIFEEFPAALPAKTIASDIDWASNENAWDFRTRLRNALKKGANFNGHYTVMMHGCGTSCQVYWVINTESGKVLGRFSTTAGAAYNLNSSLIIADNIENGADWATEYGTVSEITYFEVKNDELVPLKTLDLSTMWEDKKLNKRMILNED